MSAEQALLGAVLSGGSDLDDLFGRVDPDDFASNVHAEIWKACQNLWVAGTQPDPVTVAPLVLEVLARHQQGPDYLHHLMTPESCPLPYNSPAYADEVLAAAIRRKTQAAAKQIWQIANETPDATADEIHDSAMSALLAAAPQSASARSYRMTNDIFTEVLSTDASSRTAWSTPWPDLDDMITGLTPGRVVVVGARPGVGKSIMGAQMALGMAREHKRGALICSMEMPAVEIGHRLLAAHSGVSLTALEHGKLTVEDRALIDRRFGPISNLPLLVEDTGNQTLLSIRAAVRHGMRALPDLTLVVIDYLQLVVPSDSRRGTRAEQVGEISRGLKLIAREFNVCVVAMAQLNRGVEYRGGNRPNMADLRESGAIEADADVVILMHQPDEDTEIIEAIIAKQRSGPQGAVRLMRRGQFARLDSLMIDEIEGYDRGKSHR